jgi:putative chitinase
MYKGIKVLGKLWGKSRRRSTMLTEDMLALVIPTNTEVDVWFKAIERLFPKYEINTAERVAAFIAQCAHESNDFNVLEENLNYSETSLNLVFGRYFGNGDNTRDAKEYAHNPEKIANYVYMDEFRKYKMGNVKEGDGWLFRGRGIIQLTGRNNYAAFGKSVDMTAEEVAEYITTERGAIESACWFWEKNKLNDIADSGNIKKISKVINGGNVGLVDRMSRYEKALNILGGNIVAKAKSTVKKGRATKTKTKVVAVEYVTVSIGDNNDTVRAVQSKLKLPVDGLFGPNTKRAVKQFQLDSGLIPDGVAGPITLQKLLGK